MESTLRDDLHGRELRDLGDGLTNLKGEQYQRFAEAAGAAASVDDRRWADFAAALGIAAGDTCADTPLNTYNVGQLKFFRAVRELVEGTTVEHLQRALFEPWRYVDPPPTMRWDAADDRRHAYRADDPATSSIAPIRTERGANRLAIEALPCFPLVPQGSRPGAVGFTRAARRWTLRWPIWTEAIPLNTIRSLLTHPLVLDAPRSHTALFRLGVSEVFLAERADRGSGKFTFRSFTSGTALIGSRPA
jgi:hypothetical protein